MGGFSEEIIFARLCLNDVLTGFAAIAFRLIVGICQVCAESIFPLFLFFWKVLVLKEGLEEKSFVWQCVEAWFPKSSMVSGRCQNGRQRQVQMGFRFIRRPDASISNAGCDGARHAFGSMQFVSGTI